MDIGKESDKEIYIERPTEIPRENPVEVPAPQTVPAEPVKV